MSATGTNLDRRATAEAQTVATLRQLLAELGGTRGANELSTRGTAAHLERDLGLGSLERVELMLRLGDACGVRMQDRVMAEANTVQDLIEAVIHDADRTETDGQAGVDQLDSREPAAAVATQPASKRREDLEARVSQAETLTEILRLRGLNEPNREHIHLYEEDDVRAITFGDLYNRASGIAEELQQRGLEPGQRVAIMLPTCAEFFYTFAGILLAGGIPVPIYPPFRADRIAEYATRQANILRNAQTRFLFTFRQAEGLARLLQPRVPTLRDVINAQKLVAESGTGVGEADEQTGTWRPVEHLLHHARGEDIAFLQYTSGSTGDPKGVTLTHANLLANIRAMVERAELQPDDVAVSWLPLYHDMGLIGMWLTPLFSGNPTVIMSPLAFLSRPERWLHVIHRHRGTVSAGPNFAWELCVRKIAGKDLEGLDLSRWRAAMNGAEPVHAETIERFAARFAPYGFRREALMPVYGLAEASLAVSIPRMGSGYRVDKIEREPFESEGRAVAAGAGDAARLEFVGAGRPLSNMEVKIVSEDGRELGERREGRLWFRSASATSGYYRNPAATKELTRRDGWLDSGDRAYWAEGDLFITGRAKDLIIKAGRNLYPQEIEGIVGRVAGVRTGCVVAFGAPDERSGTERLVIAAEMRSGGDREHIAAEIGRTVQDAVGVPPDAVELLPPQAIPKTSSGKLRRGETRRLYFAGQLGKKMAPAWMQVAKLGALSAAPRAWVLIKSWALRGIEFLYGIYALAVLVLFAVPLWAMVAVMSNPKKAATLGQATSRVMLLVAGIRVEVKGAEVLHQISHTGPWIFTPNHSSYVDILVMLAYLPRGVRFVVKGEVLAMPLFGRMARRTGQFAFDRSDPQARVRQAEEVNTALRNGESVVIYPEGTFTAVTGIRPFQLGAFKAAVNTGCAICPVATRGARQILRDGKYVPKFGRVVLTFGPLLAPDKAAGDDDWREIVKLRDAAREAIARNAGEPLL
jgi:1-acyl-sn-glycerol-3-phosphate acyltransferase